MKKSSDHRKGLLLVEDENDLRSAIRDLLLTLDIDVFEAENGLQALQVFEKNNPSVIITDIKMPQMGGIEFATCIKKLKPDIPVIFFSGFADKEISIQALRLGAFDMIEKPARKDELLQTVRNAFRKSESFVSVKLQDLNLNSTQTRVLELVLKGMSNKEIAGTIRLSEQGVKYHVGNLFRRFETTNRFQLKDKILNIVGQRAG